MHAESLRAHCVSAKYFRGFNKKRIISFPSNIYSPNQNILQQRNNKTISHPRTFLLAVIQIRSQHFNSSVKLLHVTCKHRHKYNNSSYTYNSITIMCKPNAIRICKWQCNGIMNESFCYCNKRLKKYISYYYLTLTVNDLTCQPLTSIYFYSFPAMQNCTLIKGYLSWPSWF